MNLSFDYSLVSWHSFSQKRADNFSNSEQRGQSRTMLNPNPGLYGPTCVPAMRRGAVLCISGMPRTYTEADLHMEFEQFGTIINGFIRSGTAQIQFASVMSAAAAEEYVCGGDTVPVAANDMTFMRNDFSPISNSYHPPEPLEVAMQNMSISLADDGSRHLHSHPSVSRMLPVSPLSSMRQSDNDLDKAIAARFNSLPTDTGKCLQCGQDTNYTCFRCGKFFCSRECQSKSWPTHKKECEAHMPPLNFGGSRVLKACNEWAHQPNYSQTKQQNPSFAPQRNVAPSQFVKARESMGDRTAQFIAKETGIRQSEYSSGFKSGEFHTSPPTRRFDDSPKFQSGRSDKSGFDDKKRFEDNRNGNESSRYKSGPRDEGYKKPNADSSPTKQHQAMEDNAKFNKFDRPRPDNSTRTPSGPRDGMRQSNDKPRNSGYSDSGRFQSGQSNDGSNHSNNISRDFGAERVNRDVPIQPNNMEQSTMDNQEVSPARRHGDQVSREGSNALIVNREREQEPVKLQSSNNLPLGTQNRFAQSPSQPSRNSFQPSDNQNKTSEHVTSNKNVSKSSEKISSSPKLSIVSEQVKPEVPNSSTCSTNSNVSSPVPMMDIKHIKDMPTIKLENGSQVVLSHCKGAQLYVRPVDITALEEFDKLVKCLTVHCASAPPLSRAPKKKEFLACRYQLDKTFYRAAVEERVTGSDGPHKYTVRYVDFGNKEDAIPQDMVLLNKQLCEIPIMAVKTYLKGLESVLLNPEANALLQGHIQMETPLQVVFDGSNDSLSVELIEPDGSSVNEKVKKLMEPEVEEKNEPCTPAVENTSTETGRRFLFDEATYFPFPTDGSEFQVYISHVHSTLKMLMCYSDDSDAVARIASLSVPLFTHATSINEAYQPVDSELVVAKWSDGDWYRALCVEQQENGTYNVLFLDYGNSDIAKAEDIRPYADEFVKVPVLSRPCEVYGVQMSDSNLLKLEAEKEKHPGGAWVVKAVVKEDKDFMVLEIPEIVQLIG